MSDTQNKAIRSTYRGSETTKEKVREQVRERWGEEAANNFDPYSSAMTLRAWVAAGYRVKKGAKALRSITIVEQKNDRGKVIHKYKKTVCLFHFNDVERRIPAQPTPAVV